MKKVLLVLSFLAVASLAANAQVGSYSLTFDGYCDGYTLNVYNVIATQEFAGGVHYYYNSCAESTETANGGQEAWNAKLPPNGLTGSHYFSGKAKGKVVQVADQTYTQLGLPYSLEYVFNLLYCTWAIYEGPDGVGSYLLADGTCTYGPPVPVKKESGLLKTSTQR
jgi:hypothetical protein